MNARIALAVGAALAASPVPAQIPATAPAIDCRAVAAQSGGRMTQAQCEQQFGGYAAMLDAIRQPGGERPGDEAMSCEQILAEVKSMPAQGVSREHAAEGNAAAEDYKARMAKLQAEAAAASAAQTGVNVAAAAAGSVAGNAASASAMASQKAMQDAISAKARAELDPAIARMQAANTASMGDVTAMLQANPRLGRLIRLADAKRCPMN